MKIEVADWMCGPNLEGSGFTHGGNNLEGSVDDVFKIARQLFDRGLNVMIQKISSQNEGTKRNPKWTEQSILILVDNKNFRQR